MRQDRYPLPSAAPLPRCSYLAMPILLDCRAPFPRAYLLSKVFSLAEAQAVTRLLLLRALPGLSTSIQVASCVSLKLEDRAQAPLPSSSHLAVSQEFQIQQSPNRSLHSSSLYP